MRAGTIGLLVGIVTLGGASACLPPGEVACLDGSETTGRTYEIGGADVLSYRDMMLEYAAA